MEKYRQSVLFQNAAWHHWIATHEIRCGHLFLSIGNESVDEERPVSAGDRQSLAVRGHDLSWCAIGDSVVCGFCDLDAPQFALYRDARVGAWPRLICADHVVDPLCGACPGNRAVFL